MIETIKQSPAQNPDPQGHSGALGKRNFRPTKYHRALFLVCEKYWIYCDYSGKNIFSILILIIIPFHDYYTGPGRV